jgi:hypothetical protein
MTSGKILATVVGVAAAAILITQLASAKSEEEPQIVENWLNVALGPVKNTTYTCAKTGKNMAARDLTSHLPQSVFFGNSNLQPLTVIGATNVQADSIPNAGMNVQYLANNPQNQASSAQVFNNFSQAASVVEGYHEDYSNRSGSAPPVQSCTSKLDRQLSSSAGCGPQGTIANSYGKQQANALGPDYSPYEGSSLPASHFDAYEMPGGALNTLDSAGNPQSFYMTERLMYSTLNRARCPGTTDMIRGDLAIVPQGQYMQAAGTPADTLQTGAFNAMNGAFGSTPQATAALVAADSGSVRTALGGGDLTHAVLNDSPEPILTTSTFVPSAAAQLSTNMATQKGMLGNVSSGDVTLVTGYTSY